MKFLILLSFFGVTALADTYEYTLTGMTCSGCKNMVKSAVCAVPGIKDCQVEIGSMKLTSEEGKTLDQHAITEALEALNKKNDSEYKIAKATELKSKKADKK
ncbi:MAG: heavy-metal-associated domain-containing protein [Bdellovibrionaceae bacterium]|nr:heavy-metal-associated domain-containing protein [Pseudobdellovibrionaceae bacterium]